jgi:hypothetical protein
MTLRLRRGTDEQRLSIVFDEGELIYTTDTKKLYAGDGITIGGTPIGVQSVLDEDINLNNYNVTGQGNISIDGSVTASAFNGDGSGLTNVIADISEGQTYKISIAGVDSTLLVDSETSSLGGVFTDSTGSIVFDPDLGVLYVNEIVAVSQKVSLKKNSIQNGPTEFSVESVDETAILSLKYTSQNDLASSTSRLGRLTFEREDPINGLITVTNISSNNEAFQIYHSPTVDFANSRNWITFKNQNFGIGSFNPTHTLEVNGTAKISNTLSIGQLTSFERDGLVSVDNGTIIYNTTLDKFQGYQAGSWVNLDGTPPGL